MHIKTFVIGFVLALTLLLFAQKRYADQPKPSGFSAVLDLTHEVNRNTPTYGATEKHGYQLQNVSVAGKADFSGTHLEAPASFARGMWTVDAIPAERLVAPLVVLNVSKQVQSNSDYQVSMQDVADWEKTHGDIPMGAIVMAYTGSDTWNSSQVHREHFPGYSLDAAKFLTEAREIVGLGIDTPSLDNGSSQHLAVRNFTLSHSVYQLENVANLAIVPPRGATAVVAPTKLENGSVAPVRILALVRSPMASPQTSN
jgi:kynurenine formamidase